MGTSGFGSWRSRKGWLSLLLAGGLLIAAAVVATATTDDVTVRNFLVTRDDPDAWFAVAILDHAVTGEDVVGTVFQDGEITSRDASGNYQPSAAVGINGSFFDAQRLDISYVEDGIAGREYVVEDSYIHDLIRYDGAHNDGLPHTAVATSLYGTTRYRCLTSRQEPYRYSPTSSRSTTS